MNTGQPIQYLLLGIEGELTKVKNKVSTKPLNVGNRHWSLNNILFGYNFA
jgi:hypothetical protein